MKKGNEVIKTRWRVCVSSGRRDTCTVVIVRRILAWRRKPEQCGPLRETMSGEC